jgi:hypothetical protein
VDTLVYSCWHDGTERPESMSGNRVVDYPLIKGRDNPLQTAGLYVIVIVAVCIVRLGELKCGQIRGVYGPETYL